MRDNRFASSPLERKAERLRQQEATATSAKCLVHGCKNHKHEGGFVGDFCRPCWNMLTTGRIGSGATFVHTLAQGLVDLLNAMEIHDNDARFDIDAARHKAYKTWNDSK